MALHLAEISRTVTPGAHAVLLLDQAGWHLSAKLDVPNNITLMPLPPKSPELNPVENIWQFIRDNWLSNRVFQSMTTSSITAALPGTASSTSRGQSCPSACAIGHIGPDQRDLVLKAVFQRGPRKWEFVWNSIRISAPIRDDTFFHKLASREYAFAQGDVLDATLRVYQHRDEITGVFINERYEVVQVHDLIKRPRQDALFR